MNELQNLTQIFQNKIFRISDYQRGYAWQDPQLRDFWEDVINLQPDRYHYTGLLSLKVLSRVESKKLSNDEMFSRYFLEKMRLMRAFLIPVLMMT